MTQAINFKKIDMKITLKSINKLFDAMDLVGTNQIFLSKINHSQLYHDINEWFYSRKKNASDDKYIHAESYLSEFSFVRQGNRDYEKRQRITFLHYKL